MERTARYFLAAGFAALCFSCATQRKLEVIRSGEATVALASPDDDDEALTLEYRPLAPQRDTLKVKDLDGNDVLIMKAIKDENGEMVATDVLDAAVVTARFRNVAERHGKVDIGFQIIVPERMQDSKWQLRFKPSLEIMGEVMHLDPVTITGKEYRKAQLRGYQQYQRFLNSIISDTTKFIYITQLEIFLERNLPEVYAFKKDSSYVADEEFLSHYGVSEEEAVEHYTNMLALHFNERRRLRSDRMFEKYVKVPIVTEGLRLDTVIQAVNGDFVYYYVQTVNTRPKLKKIDALISGEIYEQDRLLYTIPQSEPLTFYISSISAFADGREKYLTKVIPRRVEANTACYIEFGQGRYEVKEDLGNNPSEIGRIKENLRGLLDNSTYEMDSIIITASCSPEGSFEFNRTLSKRRGTAVGEFLDAFIRQVRDSVRREQAFQLDLDGNATAQEEPARTSFISRSDPENWAMLDALVRQDENLSEERKEYYFALADSPSPDVREHLMQASPDYRYFREHLYPRLRTVRFDFHLHRKGMLKDTIHTTVLDSTYMRGIQAIQDRDYPAAVTILRPYADYNTAVAYCAMEYNESALEILSKLEKTAPVNYMLAIISSRKGDERSAVEYFMHACEQNPTYVHRGGLDPEIQTLIKRYSLSEKLGQQYDEPY